MAKKSNNKNRQTNIGSQKSSIERATELIANKKAENEAKILEDEKVKAKIEEYNNLIEDAKQKKESDEKKLKEEYELKAMELEESKKLLEEEKKKLFEDKRSIQREIAEAKSKAIEEIRNDEQSIRSKVKADLDAEWEAKKSMEKAELEKYKNEKYWEIERELDEARKSRMEAEELKRRVARESDEKLEKKLQELSEEYKNKSEKLSAQKMEYMKLSEEIALDKEDLEDEKAYVRQQREKYTKYSPEQVLRLESQIHDMEEIIKVNQEHIKELTEKNAGLEKYATTDDGRSLLVKINELESKLKEAQKMNDELANMPSLEEIAELRAKKAELEECKISLDEERQKRLDAESKISQSALSARELENARISAGALESLNNQLQMKLKYISDQYKSTQESKFPSLLQIDTKVDSQAYTQGNEFMGELKELVTYIRNYGATRKDPLYYSEETIRCFIASLGTSHLLILQGLSGTGKSSLPRLFGEALDIENSLVPVQPSWRDNRELLGYDNDFTNRFKETEFTKYLYEASSVPNQNKIRLIVLDEMNLARIEYYFADFLSVLEKEKNEWIIPLVSSYTALEESQKPKYLNYDNAAANILVTDNIWFIGTANNDDSTSLITDKVYDRAQILDMDKREDPFEGERVRKVSLSLSDLSDLFSRAKSKKENQMSKEDWDKVDEIDMYLMAMDITFGNRIKNQIENFVPIYVECGGTKEGAIDYLFTHKILRKLDERYEPYLINDLKELRDEIINVYGESAFPQSIAKIKKLIDKINPGDSNGY